MGAETTFLRNQEKIERASDQGVNAAVKELLKQAKSFEEDRVERAHNSEKQAWKVATAFGVIGVLSVGAVIGLTPFKEVIPYLVKVDNNTGQTEVVKQVADGEMVSYGEVLDKFFTNKFITVRNSYDWQTIQSDYNAMALMSADKVLAPYINYMNAESEDSPLNKFGESNSVEVKVKTITFLPASEQDNMVAQVAFVRTILDSNGLESVKYKPTHWQATLTFDYLAEIKTEEERLINPLGYRATSYREDIISK